MGLGFVVALLAGCIDVDEVVEKLKQHHYPVEALHGDVAQSVRTKVITRFKGKHFPLLVATDVAARGIDVNDLTHVINYSIPQSPDIYIHRVGRTGRAGKEGKAVTFVTPGEIRRIRHIQEVIRAASSRPLLTSARWAGGSVSCARRTVRRTS